MRPNRAGNPDSIQYKSLKDLVPDFSESIFNASGSTFIEREYKFTESTGKERVFRVRGFPISDKRNAAQKFGVIATDITRFKETEAHLRQKEALYRGLTEDLPLMLCACLPDGRIKYANPAFVRFFGEVKASAPMRFFNDLISNRRDSIFSEIRNAVDVTRMQTSDEFTSIDRRGNKHLIHWIFRGVFNDKEHLVEIHCLGEDITQQREINQNLTQAREDALRASQAKSDFLASMSHEIRTPLNGIIGMTEYLRSRDMSEDDQNTVSIIYQSGNILLELINDILDFSKIEAGQLELEPAEVDLQSAIVEVKQLMEERAHAKDLIFEASLNFTNRIYHIDFFRLRQVLINLIGNAIKFTKRGGTIQLIARDTEDGDLTLDVVDTGVGISPEKKAKLFQPFVQADGSVGKKFGGTGLGLSICKRIVEAMGGDITVESEPDRGSHFSVRLPHQSISSTHTYKSGDTAGATKGDFSGMKAIVLDDDRINNLVLARLLQKMGLHVESELNVASFYEHVKPCSFDYYFIDLQMPSTNGIQIAEDIRSGKVEGISKDACLIAYTASATAKIRERCKVAGFDTYLSKPVTQDALLNCLKKSHA